MQGIWIMKPGKKTASDKQLRSVELKRVLEKRRLDQALSAKEFAILAGISYSNARQWFNSPGFPVFRGRVFWQDFVAWRTHRLEFNPQRQTPAATRNPVISNLPPRALQILREAYEQLEE